MLKVLFFITLMLAISKVSGYGQTLADCVSVAGLFRTTCQTTSTVQTFDNTFAGETVTCTGMSGCPDSVSPSAGSCTWTRKLCITCSTSNNEVYMRVQSNGLPDHCYGGAPSVETQEIDWTVKFNPVMTTTITSASSQSTYDTTLCSPNAPADSSVPSSNGFTQNVVGQTPGVVGVALNGVAILNGVSAENVDPFYPQSWSGAGTVQTETVDACIAHPAGDGMYHYHMLPPCVVNSDNLQDNQVCNDVTACTSDVKGYALTSYTSQANFLKVIAIAKDGHLIYGPYESANTLFDCTTLDMCHGKTIDGSYAYVWTNTWPYNVACWGPGESTTFEASCSSNTCEYTVSGVVHTVSIIITSIIGLFYLFIF